MKFTFRNLTYRWEGQKTTTLTFFANDYSEACRLLANLVKDVAQWQST